MPYIYNTLTTPLYKACIKIHGKIFVVPVENRQKRESLAQQIFPIYGTTVNRVFFEPKNIQL